MTRKSNPASSFLQQLGLQFELPFFRREEPPAAPVKETSDKRRLIQCGSQILEYGLRRSRRKSIGFVIDENGLMVTAPRWVSLSEIESAIREKQRWIFAKLVEMRDHRRAVPKVDWCDGGTLPYFGAPLTLRIRTESKRSAVHFDADTRELHLPLCSTAQQIKDRAQAWLQNEVKRVFAERLDFYAPRLGVSYRQFRLSSARTRWGSCSADGRILLNWRLVHFPMSSIDYVVAHELAHLKEMNHGPRFWQTVADVFPEFESERDYLKNPPPELLPKL